MALFDSTIPANGEQVITPTEGANIRITHTEAVKIYVDLAGVPVLIYEGTVHGSHDMEVAPASFRVITYALPSHVLITEQS